jgi:hypothetical protein
MEISKPRSHTALTSNEVFNDQQTCASSYNASGNRLTKHQQFLVDDLQGDAPRKPNSRYVEPPRYTHQEISNEFINLPYRRYHHRLFGAGCGRLVRSNQFWVDGTGDAQSEHHPTT